MDPGFPVGLGANPPGEGHQQTIFAKFSEKLDEIEKILSRGEGAGVPYLGSATGKYKIEWIRLLHT